MLQCLALTILAWSLLISLYNISYYFENHEKTNTMGGKIRGQGEINREFGVEGMFDLDINFYSCIHTRWSLLYAAS